MLPVVTSVTSNLESSNSKATHQILITIIQSIFDIVPDTEQLLYSYITTPASLLKWRFFVTDGDTLDIASFSKIVLEENTETFFVGI